jgi:SAM-dependent methyltransferase
MEINNYDLVADLYDIYVPVTFDIDFFLQETKKTCGQVLELMSGTGRVSLPLLEAGVKLTCVDFSAALNEILESKLRQKGLQADVYTMDVCQLAIPKKFAMIIIPFHSFAHITSPDDQAQALARIKQHLAPGGTFICTLGNPKVRQQAVDGQYRLLRKYTIPEIQGTLLLWVVENFSATDPQVVEALQFYEQYDCTGVLTSKRLLELHFRLTGKDEFEALAQAAGFKIKALYGDYSYAEFREQSSPYMIWLFKRCEEKRDAR